MAILSIPEDSVWDVWPISGRKDIYVRPSYKTALNHCHTAWNVGFQIIYLKGTPGVGKSVCLDYFLSSLIANKKKVLLIKGPTDQAFLFLSHSTKPRKTNSGALEALRGEWAKEADYVLIDPPENSAESQKYAHEFLHSKKTAAAVPPDPENLKKISK